MRFVRSGVVVSVAFVVGCPSKTKDVPDASVVVDVPSAAVSVAAPPSSVSRRTKLAALYQAKIFAPTVTGGKVEDVARALRGLREAWLDCYIGPPQDDRGFGTLVITTKLDGTGHPTKTRAVVDKDAQISASVSSCITGVLDRATFDAHPDKPGGEITMSIPLDLDQSDEVKWAMVRLINGTEDAKAIEPPPWKTEIHVRELSSAPPISGLDVTAHNLASTVRWCLNKDTETVFEGDLTIALEVAPDGRHEPIKATPGKGVALTPAMIACVEDATKTSAFKAPSSTSKVKLTIALVRATPPI